MSGGVPVAVPVVVQVYTADEVAALLRCAVKTVEDMARRGELSGIKPGGGWVFPAGALAQQLDTLALEQAAQRRKPAQVAAVAVNAVAGEARPRRRKLPGLVEV